ncbi:scavenger receptor class B member 1-like [Daktulosphaira vitifoliae]|uniref:scavenger receptor class B member 1-like n=1 Tax=Daktulosphaira vitifoliae TaxID=58002 RepID=UPI0021AA9962|nr:scavenger receptor class B member 1-like [Daktulosphaira vitifoliae]XP_050531126.1 scavenger receptor class B member 1-like [Daktulosphaira vitifoliae]
MEDQKPRKYYKNNIAALGLTAAALVKGNGSEEDKAEDAKWPCLDNVSTSLTLTETASTTSRDASSNASKQKRKPFCTIGNLFFILTALLLFLIGSFTIIHTPFEILMNERLKMVRGLPAYEWWKNPPDEVLLRVYLFNVTNSERFENGLDNKLELNEIGPIVFRELLRHSDVRFNENGTLTYVATRTTKFLPELTNVDLNAQLVLPNFAALGMASYLYDASSFTKYGFQFMMKMLDTQMFVKTTIDDCLWNMTDPLVQKAKSMMPGLVPEENMGILYQIYNKFTDEVTVHMGPENSARFFMVDNYNGRPNFGIWEDPKCDSVQGATEGVTYHQFISKTDTLKYLRKTMCRVTPLKYQTEVSKSGMSVYKFVLPNNVYAHPQLDPTLEDCFSNPKSFPLPSGLTDVSPCYYDFPIAASFPHFLNGDPSLRENISGLYPSEEKHSSFLIVEPLTGVPFESRARSQSNLVVRPISGFSKIDKFSNMVIPMFWAEYNQVGLPWYITSLMYFTVIILPYTQTVGSISMMIVGIAMIGKMILDLAFGFKKPLYSYSSLDLLPSI